MFIITAHFTTQSGDYYTNYHHQSRPLGVMEGDETTVKAILRKMNDGFNPWVTFTATEVGPLAGLADVAKAAESLVELFSYEFSNQTSRLPQAA